MISKRLLDTCEHSVFVSDEWLKVLSVFKNCIVLRDKDGEIVFFENDGNFESLSYGGYGGFIGKEFEIAQVMGKATKTISIVDYYGNCVSDQFKNWERIEASTYVIDMSLFKPSHGILDNLRMSKKIGVKVEKTSDPLRIYRIANKCSADFIAKYSFEFYKAVNRFAKDVAQFYIASLDGIDIAASVQLHYRNELFNLINVCDASYKKSGAITAIMFQALEDYSPAFYNLGASKGWGVDQFKKMWGAPAKTYSILRYVSSPLFYFKDLE